MSKRIFFYLFLINSTLLIFYHFPFFDAIRKMTEIQANGSIGIIGGADGPTAIYVKQQFNWLPIVLSITETIWGIFLYKWRSNK